MNMNKNSPPPLTHMRVHGSCVTPSDLVNENNYYELLANFNLKLDAEKRNRFVLANKNLTTNLDPTIMNKQCTSPYK